MVSSPELTQNASTTESLKLLSINEAREKLKIRHETVRKLIEEGKIEVVIIGKRYKIPMSSLIKFIEENSRRLSDEAEEQRQTDERDLINNKIDLIIKKHNRKS